MFNKYFIFVVLSFITLKYCFAQQNIGGVINDYSRVTNITFPNCDICDQSDACLNAIQVLNPQFFSAGDRVLIIQMAGANIITTNTANAGQVTAINNAGNYEFFTVKEVVGNTVYPNRKLGRTYDAPGLVQLVRIPTYTGNVNVTSQLTALPWNPNLSIGGVLALFVEGDLILNADLNVQGMGYIGTIVNVNGSPDNCGINPNTQFVKPANDVDVSPKGNGIVLDNPLFNGGRAPKANGGGGGVSGDSGGGGGSNYGAGGRGGDRWCDMTNRAGGLGGISLLPFLQQNKVFLGGAGGSGFVTSGAVAEAADGGGIIVVKANSIVGNGFTINARGTSPLQIGGGIDGGGGGGAGGTIALAVDAIVGNLNVDVSGGNGQSLGTPVLHGPGGGGGGGALLHTLESFPTTVNVRFNGGNPGFHSGNNSTNSNNALPGEPGGIVYSPNVIREFNIGTIDVKNTICTACNGEILFKDFNSTGNLRYSINGGQTFQDSPLFKNLCEDTFVVNVLDELGCVYDTIITNQTDTLALLLDIGKDTTLCKGTYVVVGYQGDEIAKYYWNTGALTPYITVHHSGKYTLNVLDTLGCPGLDSLQLLFLPFAELKLPNDTVLCVGDSLWIAAQSQNFTVLWNTGAQTDSILVKEKGWYKVIVSNVIGCSVSDSVFVRFSEPTVQLPNDTSICINTFPLNIVARATNFQSFLWQNNSTANNFSIPNAGKYFIEAIDEWGCKAKDSITVGFYSLPTPVLRADTTICFGEKVRLNLPNIYTNYAWNPTGFSGNSIEVNLAGQYSVEVTDNNGCKGCDTFNLTVNPLPKPNLGKDTSVCFGENITLKPTQAFSQYKWLPNNEITNQITVSIANTYILTVTNNFNCIGKDTIIVGIDTLPVISLGPDKTICANDSVSIGVNNLYVTYNWLPNIGNKSTIVVKNSGNYQLQVIDANGCKGRASVNVFVQNLPQPNLGVEITICKGDSVLLNPGDFDKYFWLQNNVNTKTVWVKNAQKYIVEVADNNNCKAKDTIEIKHQILQLDLAPIFYTCANERVTISPTTIDPLITNLQWNTNQTGSSITTGFSGKYWINGTSALGCSVGDTTELISVPYPQNFISGDSIACEGDLVQLSLVTDAQNFVWKDGVSSRNYSVNQTGWYGITAQNTLGSKTCVTKDSVKVTFYDYPNLINTPKQIFCFNYGDAFNVQTNIQANWFVWDNNLPSNSAIKEVKQSGLYNVIAYNHPFCTITQDIEVEELCPMRLFVPNAFTPNDDNLNETFKPVAVNFIDYEIFIFNRWGELIYQSQDIESPWNGTYLGNPVQQDVYVWLIIISGLNNDLQKQNQQHTGTVTLYR
ncbi:MAG: hypothetical protein RLZZ414_2298 [Bacteroidota bacterium]|jgi:gliding motility-associated-like protein